MEVEPAPGFRERVYELMAIVPYGRVITYGDIAGLAGQANAARIVGGIAHYGPTELPWHRLVNRFGGLAAGFHGGREVQQQLLEAEGVTCTDFIVDNFKELRWQPQSLNPQQPLVVIVGPTASGKTGLAIELAKKYNGEIICADSRTVYKGMDIGTAKPSVAERATIPHWGLDLVEPGEKFTAYDFKVYADAKVEEIRQRGHVPFLVGGTGLYVDAVVLDYEFADSFDGALRSSLENKTLEELHKYCEINNVILPENSKNKRYVINAILRKSINTKSKGVPTENTIVVGIATEKDSLLARMKARAKQLFNDGVVSEATTLGNKYGWEAEVLKSNVYRVIKDSLYTPISQEEMINRTVILDWQLAKRQLTWLKRDTFIKWLSIDEAREYLAGRLAK